MRTRRRDTALFLGYAALMLWLLFLRPPMQAGTRLNLIPLHTIRLYLGCLRPPLRWGLVRAAIVNLAGNIVMFLPLGFFPPRLHRHFRRLPTLLLCAAAVIAAVELTQRYLTVGTCDVDDLLLNLLGTAAGYGLYRLCPHKTL